MKEELRKLLCFELSNSEYNYLTQIIPENVPISKVLFALINSIREEECEIVQLDNGEWKIIAANKEASVVNSPINNSEPEPELEHEQSFKDNSQPEQQQPPPAEEGLKLFDSSFSYTYKNVPLKETDLPIIMNLIGLGKLSTTEVDEDDVLDILDSLSYELYSFYNKCKNYK